MKNAPDYAKHPAKSNPASEASLHAERDHKREHHGRTVKDNMELFPDHYLSEEEDDD